MNSYRNAPAARFTPPKPKFRKLSSGGYEVSLNGTVAGTVIQSQFSDVWNTFYNDGAQGWSGNTRIEAAWALINS